MGINDNCPNCNYPDGPGDNHYKGIYDPGKKCGGCGHIEEAPVKPKYPLFPTPMFDYTTDEWHEDKPKPMEITKDELRDAIKSNLDICHGSGMPIDGEVSIMTNWVMAHLNGGTKVKEVING